MASVRAAGRSLNELKALTKRLDGRAPAVVLSPPQGGGALRVGLPAPLSHVFDTKRARPPHRLCHPLIQTQFLPSKYSWMTMTPEDAPHALTWKAMQRLAATTVPL